MAHLAFSFTPWATRLGRMLDCVATKGPVNYYMLKETLKGKGYGGGTMQRDLQLLTQLGFIRTKNPRTKKKNRKYDYDLTADGIILLLGITSYLESFRSSDHIRGLLAKYADLLPKISAIYGDIERLHIDKLAQKLLLTVASQFYDKTTISSLHDIHPLETRKKYHTLLVEKRYGSTPFEHRFFIGLAPPTAYLAAPQRLRLENALRSMDGATLRHQIITELNQQREYYSAMVDVTEEKIKFLNLEH